MMVNINFIWHIGCDNLVDLPDGKTMVDIKEVTGSSGGGTIYFHDGSELDFDVNADQIELADYLSGEADEIVVLTAI